MIEAPTAPSQHVEATIRVIGDVLSAMVHITAEPIEESSEQYPLTAAIYFAGGGAGAVLVSFEPKLAFAATAQLMSVDEPREVDDDVRDAVAEIAHMIAGNLKSVLPADLPMSMPSVIEGGKVTVVGSHEVSRRDFSTPSGRFAVTLIEMPQA